MFTSGYVNTETILHFFNINNVGFNEKWTLYAIRLSSLSHSVLQKNIIKADMWGAQMGWSELVWKKAPGSILEQLICCKKLKGRSEKISYFYRWIVSILIWLPKRSKKTFVLWHCVCSCPSMYLSIACYVRFKQSMQKFQYLVIVW